jgi:long-subunit acyl-CoA synthetase (AMP-forming)
MSDLLAAVEKYAKITPQVVAIEGNDVLLTYGELVKAVSSAADLLNRYNVTTVALLVDNGPLWCVADLACVQAQLPLVPVPHFFSHSQIMHLISTAGTDGILTEQPGQILSLLAQLRLAYKQPVNINVGGKSLSLIQLNMPKVELPDDCAKITFTSGSTGEPKGVCLRQQVMETVAKSLADATGANEKDRHISLLPYATLLENIGGIYASLISGATLVSPPLSAVGLNGASALDSARFVAMLIQSGATSCIMIPQMLHVLVTAVETGAPKPEALRFIAVGGAPVSKHMLQCADKLGLPVYEGYGLSEAASVVTVNRFTAHKIGSVGRVLPHSNIALADDGEILVKGGLFSGYLGDRPFAGEYWPTGDIGYMDDEGFLFLSGRKKHIFITAFGRNVSPEWVEGELSIEPVIAQCCVFGEARPFNISIIVARENSSREQVQQAVDKANARLPDYARISRWLIADEPFSVGNGLWTGTARPRRQHIFAAYEDRIHALYQEC